MESKTVKTAKRVFEVALDSEGIEKAELYRKVLNSVRVLPLNGKRTEWKISYSKRGNGKDAGRGGNTVHQQHQGPT